MIYQRAELHNHTWESDGDMLPEELAEHAAEDHFGILALTDHNTLSGIDPCRKACREHGIPFLPGIEETTLYGHILGLNAKEVTDISLLDPMHADAFVRRMKESCDLVGMAHPFCLGEPVTCGCRMDLKFDDPDCLDYIEVFNDAQSDLIHGNYDAFRWWEELVFKGCHIACTAGKDLHRLPEKRPDDFWTTFFSEESDDDPVQGLIQAIRSQQTFVTRGPLMHLRRREEDLVLHVDLSVDLPEWQWHPQDQMILVIRTKNGGSQYPLQDQMEIPVPSDPQIRIFEIYQGSVQIEDLVCAGLPISIF